MGSLYSTFLYCVQLWLQKRFTTCVYVSQSCNFVRSSGNAGKRSVLIVKTTTTFSVKHLSPSGEQWVGSDREIKPFALAGTSSGVVNWRSNWSRVEPSRLGGRNKFIRISTPPWLNTIRSLGRSLKFVKDVSKTWCTRDFRMPIKLIRLDCISVYLLNTLWCRQLHCIVFGLCSDAFDYNWGDKGLGRNVCIVNIIFWMVFHPVDLIGLPLQLRWTV